jgi:hypothetical protein
MSERPQNEPNSTKVSPKKRKPMTDEERRTWSQQEEARLEEIVREVERSRSFHKRVSEVGLFRALWPKKN